MGIGELWSTLFFEPMLNGLLLLYGVLGSNFGLSVIAFTIIIRTIMVPLTLRQLHASRSMSSLQPKIQEIQKKYGKNREEVSKATMALYKEHGVNPMGCAVPTLLQFPIWIGLYQSIQLAMAERPDSLYELGKHVYAGFANITSVIPLNNTFLWLNLAHPDPLYLLAVLVAGSTWIQQKMMTVPSTDAQQAQMNKMMGYMMPLMMGFFTINFPSGLALYWLISNIYSVVIQYFVTGWGTLAVPASWRTLPGAGTMTLTAPAAPSKNGVQITKSEDTEAEPAPTGTRNGTTRPGKRSGKRSASPRRS